MGNAWDACVRNQRIQSVMRKKSAKDLRNCKSNKLLHEIPEILHARSVFACEMTFVLVQFYGPGLTGAGSASLTSRCRQTRFLPVRFA
jgi:hypothetical protein